MERKFNLLQHDWAWIGLCKQLKRPYELNMKPQCASGLRSGVNVIFLQNRYDIRQCCFRLLVASFVCIFNFNELNDESNCSQFCLDSISTWVALSQLRRGWAECLTRYFVSSILICNYVKHRKTKIKKPWRSGCCINLKHFCNGVEEKMYGPLPKFWDSCP
jgi:hypothetical protein